MKEREYTFDVLRVIAMIMVIIIHVSNVYTRSYNFIDTNSYLVSLIFNTISRISVPIFFMISGALLLDRSFDFKKYKKRIFKIILLIVVWDILYLIWEYYFLGVTYDKLYKLILEPYRAHLWFLYTIVILYVIQPLLKLILDKLNKPLKIVLFIIWLLLSTISMYNLSIANIFTIFSNIGFFILGKYLYDYVSNDKRNNKKYTFIMVLLLIISFVESVYLNYTASLKFNMFYNLFFAYRTPFIILASFIVFKLVYIYCHNKKPKDIILLGSDLSLGVYLIHGMFLDVTTKYVDYKNVIPIIGIPSFTLYILVLSLISVYVLRKIKYMNKLI